jgi:hypothetical protein
MGIPQRLTGLILAVLLSLTAISVMAETVDTQCKQGYLNMLDRYYALLIDDNADGSGEGEAGVWEAKLYPGDTGSVLDSVGYALHDMSGDGVPELLIGAITHRDNQLSYGSKIYAMYTCVDGVPTLTFESWARSRFYTMEEGTFFYQGSSSAMVSLFGKYTLSPDGVCLSCNDLYFTDEKPSTPEETVLYHNQTGSMEPAMSEELSVPEEQFWRLEAELENRVQDIVLIPFSQYTPSSNDNGHSMPVQAHWTKVLPANYDEYRASGEAHAGVLFSATSPVKDFRLLAITLLNVDSDGKTTFLTEDMYHQDILTSEHPLLAYLSFFGDLPNKGIAFVG